MTGSVLKHLPRRRSAPIARKCRAEIDSFKLAWTSRLGRHSCPQPRRCAPVSAWGVGSPAGSQGKACSCTDTGCGLVSFGAHLGRARLLWQTRSCCGATFAAPVGQSRRWVRADWCPGTGTRAPPSCSRCGCGRMPGCRRPGSASESAPGADAGWAASTAGQVCSGGAARYEQAGCGRASPDCPPRCRYDNAPCERCRRQSPTPTGLPSTRPR